MTSTNVSQIDIFLLRRDRDFGYYYNFRLFSTNELRAFGNVTFTQDFLRNSVQVLSVRDLITRRLTSEPILLLTDRNEYIIVTLNGDDINIVMESSGDARNQDIERILSLKVPDINNIVPGRVSDLLPRFNLPRSDRLEEYLGDLLNRGVSTFSQINIQEPIPSSPPESPESPESPRSPETTSQSRYTQSAQVIQVNENTLMRESYETLLKQLYGMPVQLPEYLVINDLRVNFVPFEQIVQAFGQRPKCGLSQNQIERYIIDPLLQPFVGPPGTPYRIFTLFGKNGVTYLVRARYNVQTNQILP